MSISLKPEYLRHYKDIGLLFWKYGRGDLVKSSGIEKVFEDAEEKHKAVSSSKPEELAADLEKMGPIYIKLGQLLSTRDDILPPEYLEALSRLQDTLTPFSFEEVEHIIEEELGVGLKGFHSLKASRLQLHHSVRFTVLHYVTVRMLP